MKHNELVKSPIEQIKYMYYNVFVTTDDVVVNQQFNLSSAVLKGGSYCYYVNGTYRTLKWIKEHGVVVLGFIDF